jgi:hypothetical protein
VAAAATASAVAAVRPMARRKLTAAAPTPTPKVTNPVVISHRVFESTWASWLIASSTTDS